ncbi:MAG TPA: hypothetical protein VKR53_21160 [Puia sp.]|nr:hypothetical protein [Puia sp.]
MYLKFISKADKNMVKYFFCFILSSPFFVSCNRNEKRTVAENNQQHKMPDEDGIKKAVDDAYQIISFKAGQSLNYDSIRTSFIPQAQLMNFRTDSLQVLTLDQFIDAYKNFVKDAGIKSFYEKEVFGKTDQFGKIAQRMSTYASYINTMNTVGERGVNSFQLVKTPKGWRVSSIIWDVERTTQPIPDYYLNTDSN